jgi:formylglycine-generating enzyme required for sulfatase activity
MKRLYALFFAVFVSINIQAQQMHSIPQQKFLFPNATEKQEEISVEAFEISDFISLGEYKEYLAEIKKDSSFEYYRSQLPDSSITIQEDVFVEYLQNPEYENYPVLGISWENAMNFCKWKSLKENNGEIKFIYRLPLYSEWQAAQKHLEKEAVAHDFNKLFSDYLLNSYYEQRTWESLENIYFHKKNDHAYFKRKCVIGNSYRFNNQEEFNILPYSLANEGYRHIGFRIVKTKIDTLEKQVLKYWAYEK